MNAPLLTADAAGQSVSPGGSQTPPHLVETRGLKVWFKVNAGSRGLRRRFVEIRALDGVDVAVDAGESLAVVGESGSGKTTLARVVCGITQPTEGDVLYKGNSLIKLRHGDYTSYRRAVQMIFQDPYASLDPRLTVELIVGESLEVNRLCGRSERRRAVKDLLRVVGLKPEFACRYPHELSGGQRQRVAVARSLASSPELVMADEPTSALDVSAQAQVLNLIRDLQDKLRLTVIYITHNLPTVRYVADRVAVMYLGRVVEIGPTSQVLYNARHPYTRSLLASAPAVDQAVKRQTGFLVTGETPDPSAPPSGCRFHPRCWWRTRMDNPRDCEEVEPPSPQADDATSVACHFSEAMQEAIAGAAEGGIEA